MSFLRVIVVFLLPALVWAAEPWLLAFPEISYDSVYAYFAGPRWAAVYVPPWGNVIAAPRDSLNLPAPVRVPFLVAEDLGYVTADSVIVIFDGTGGQTRYLLPLPTSDAISCMAPADGPEITIHALHEGMTTHLVECGNQIWFGLTLADSTSGATAAGVGWFNPDIARFGRLYVPALGGYRAQWVGTRQDTVFALFVPADSTGEAMNRLFVCSCKDPMLAERTLESLGVPGAQILNMAAWEDTLLLATDAAVAIWKPRRQPKVWQTSTYAARGTSALYLKSFSGKSASDPIRLLPLRAYTPLEIRAKRDDWLQVTAPISIEGYLAPEDWERHAVLWSQPAWNCRTPGCYARVRVPRGTKMEIMEFINAPVSYLGRDDNGIRVSFRTAWAKEEDLAPVLLTP